MTKEAKRTALIIVDHGSRLEEANRLLDSVAQRLQTRLPHIFIQPAHMELAEPSIEQAFALCAQQGAEEVIVFPYFLGPGRHSREDIPRLCKEAAAKHPTLSYCITEPFGLDDKMIDIICDRTGNV